MKTMHSTLLFKKSLLLLIWPLMRDALLGYLPVIDDFLMCFSCILVCFDI